MSSTELLANLYDEIRDHGFEKVFKRYYSLYRALVTDNTDLEGRGRVTVQVPNLFGENDLPELAVPKDFRGAGPGKGEFFPPDIGDWVYVEFEGGDQRFPVYSGGWVAEEELPAEFAYSGSPAVRGYKNKYGQAFTFDESEGKQKVIINTPGGHFFILDDTAGSEGIFLIHKSGAQMQTDAGGNVKIFGSDGSFIFVDAATGSVTITCKAGSFVNVTEAGIIMMDASGTAIQTVTKEAISNVVAGTFSVNSNAFAVNSGSAEIKDTAKAGFKVANGQVAIGGPAAELLDLVSQLIDALVNAPTLCTTGTGPSGPLSPPASVQLTLVKTLLTTIKGSL